VISTFRPIYKHKPPYLNNFLDRTLKFAVRFDNTYQLALVVTHITEYFVVSH